MEDAQEEAHPTHEEEQTLKAIMSLAGIQLLQLFPTKHFLSHSKTASQPTLYPLQECCIPRGQSFSAAVTVGHCGILGGGLGSPAGLSGRGSSLVPITWFQIYFFFLKII